MRAIKLEVTIDEAAAKALPALRPLLGKRVEIIALQTGSEPPGPSTQKLTFDELVARRVDAPPGAGPLSDDDIQRAIIEGALGGNA